LAWADPVIAVTWPDPYRVTQAELFHSFEDAAENLTTFRRRLDLHVEIRTDVACARTSDLADTVECVGKRILDIVAVHLDGTVNQHFNKIHVGQPLEKRSSKNASIIWTDLAPRPALENPRGGEDGLFDRLAPR
jgi:hypothetical protein